MRALITLARFVSPEEQRDIADRMRAMKYIVSSDPLAPQRRLIVDGPDPGKLFKIEGVSQVIPIYAEKSTKTLSEATKIVVTALKKLGLDSFTIHLKTLGDVPFHEKALRERVRKKLKHNPGRVVYVEAKAQQDSVLVRVGVPEIFHQDKNVSIILVLESPKTSHEIADFLRLAIVFGVPLRISIEGDLRTLHALQEAKQIVKGYEKTTVTTYKTTLDAIRGLNAVAFSLWGDSDERVLRELHAEALVFGNEERGLKLSTQKACKAVVHLGPRSSEPMRASQAAAYAMGVLA